MKTPTRAIVLLTITGALVFTFIPYIKEITTNIKPAEKETISLLFAGDLMFDRYIRQVAQKNGNELIFEEIKPILAKHDLVIVNLESPITNYESRSIGTVVGEQGHYTFTADPSVAKTLSENNIRLVNLANNHIMNFGKNGLEQTKSYLQSNDIEFFGISEKPQVVIDLQGYKIGFIGYTDFMSNSLELCLGALSEIKDQVDLVVVYTHWGTEYSPTAESRIQALAYKFVDEGADLVVGSHPHVVQQKETYKEKTIYYSLGNFVMDQYFNKNVNKGLLIEVEIEKKTNHVMINEIPIKMLENGKTVLNIK